MVLNKFISDGKPAHWASINHSIFLCFNCSRSHIKLGDNISYIRSIILDNWSDIQLLIMKKGGNSRLKSFVNDYPEAKENKEQLHCSKLLESYRKTVIV